MSTNDTFFKDFVNTELPKRIYTNEAITSIEEGMLLLSTGVGLGINFYPIGDTVSDSLYGQVATYGYTGSKVEWLNLLANLDNLDTGGSVGGDGASAYELAVQEGFTGTLSEWLDSLKGDKGESGQGGTAGDSAYQVAVKEGFTGTKAEWLGSLKGADGAKGDPGADGSPGTNGTDGTDGASAYELAVQEGFTGTIAEWFDTLRGQDGNPGQDGKDAYTLAVEQGFTGTVDDWLTSLKGEKGDPGQDGQAGAKGDPGAEGQSAYDLAVEQGFTGTESEWLGTLKGPQGDPGTEGPAGPKGVDGDSAYEVAVQEGYTGTVDDWLASLGGSGGTLAVEDQTNTTFNDVQKIKVEGDGIEVSVANGVATFISSASTGGGVTGNAANIVKRRFTLMNNNVEAIINVLAYGTTALLDQVTIALEDSAYIRFDNIPDGCLLKDITITYEDGFNNNPGFGIRYPEPFGDTLPWDMHIPYMFMYSETVPSGLMPLTLQNYHIENGIVQIEKSNLVKGKGYRWRFVLL